MGALVLKATEIIAVMQRCQCAAPIIGVAPEGFREPS
jgi:hypothetical protein